MGPESVLEHPSNVEFFDSSGKSYFVFHWYLFEYILGIFVSIELCTGSLPLVGAQCDGNGTYQQTCRECSERLPARADTNCSAYSTSLSTAS